MVINITDEFIKEGERNPKISSALKYIFYFLEMGYHKWWLKISDNEDLYNTNALGSYREFIIKESKKNALNMGSPSYYLQILPDKRRLLERKKELEQKYPDAIFQLLANEERLIVEYKNKTCEIITTELIENFIGGNLKVVLEDISSDKTFIELCIELFGNLNKQEIDNLRLDFINGSGNNTKKQVEHFEGKHRVICIIDSDQVSPGQYLDSRERRKKRNIESACKNLGVPIIVLSKREIENYIPDTALIKHGVPQEHPYFIFTEEQKDYFDMKKGLLKRDLEFPIWQDREMQENEELAASGTDSDRILILQGHGDDIWKAFLHVKTREELETRDINQELPALVNKILEIV